MSAGADGAGAAWLPTGDLRVRLVRSARRRTVQIVVSAEGHVEVRGPPRCTVAEALAVLRTHETWLERTLLRVQESATRRPVLAEGARLRLVDAELTLRLGRSPRPQVTRRGDTVWLCGPVPEVAALRPTLVAWYREQARAWLPHRLAELALQVGLRPRRVIIRDQRSRWGSCSSRGTISLNWRLVLVPRPLADYVLVHELCHLRHLSHSGAFWRLVATTMPDWRERRARLHEIQAKLPL